MRRILIGFVLVAVFAACSAAAQTAGWAPETEKSYIAAVARHFDVTVEEVSDLQDLGLAAEDLPVALLLAKRSKVSVDQIAENRGNGQPWLDIAELHDLGADVFYIKIGAKYSSETYSPILTKYISLPRSKWKNLELSDEEVVNLVNLKFIASYHDSSMFEVMAMRDYGKTFPRINDQVAGAKADLLARNKAEMDKAANAGF